MPLNVRSIRSLVKAETPGMWAVGKGLSLVISVGGSASWALRYQTLDGKRRLMKLADYEPIDEANLAALQSEAAIHRKAIKAGHDPLAEREAEKRTANAQVAIAKTDTFRNAALTYIAENRAGWKNAKHRQQWENTLTTYAYPLIGEKAVHEVTLDDVKRVLQQPYARKAIQTTLWKGARETASRLRSRIETVIKAAKASAIADNDNPDRQVLWRDHHNPADGETLRFAGLNGRKTTTSFKAMDWTQVPAFFFELRAKSDISAKALALTILCAVRSNETYSAEWHEFDLDAAVWTIPADRMKMGKEHRVPLSTSALSVLRSVPRIDGNPYVFPGAKNDRPLSSMAMLEMLRGMRLGERLTVHGFRSAFRDWITETTLHPDTVAEQALAHSITNKVERAYRRGDAFDRRKDLMQQWADYLSIEPAVYRDRWSRMLC